MIFRVQHWIMLLSLIAYLCYGLTKIFVANTYHLSSEGNIYIYVILALPQIALITTGVGTVSNALQFGLDQLL